MKKYLSRFVVHNNRSSIFSQRNTQNSYQFVNKIPSKKDFLSQMLDAEAYVEEELLEYESFKLHYFTKSQNRTFFVQKCDESLLPYMNEFLQKCHKLTAEENQQFLLLLRNLPEKLSIQEKGVLREIANRLNSWGQSYRMKNMNLWETVEQVRLECENALERYVE